MARVVREATATDCPSEGTERWMNYYRSALLGIMALMVGIVAWEGERVIQRLDNIETSQGKLVTAAAVTETRVGNLEQDTVKQWETINGHEHRITVLEQQPLRTPRARP